MSCPEYRERLKEVYITEAQIKAKVAELAAVISKNHRSSFKEGEVVAVGVPALAHFIHPWWRDSPNLNPSLLNPSLTFPSRLSEPHTCARSQPLQ